MSHTAGPWKVMPGKSQPRICVDGDKGWPIVVISSGHSEKATIANEHLMAAAPDMLEALELIVGTKAIELIIDDDAVTGIAIMIRKAIKKARGES